jgi:hypothetical protein
MKKSVIIFVLALMASVTFGQAPAKKPTIMVVPSDRYCIEKGYSMTFDNQGTQVTLPDYKKAFQTDGDLRLVISKMSGIMADRGFPLKDLEQELKNLSQEAAESSMLTGKSGGGIVESPIDALKRSAKADIIMDLDFRIERQGPKKYIVFTLNGLDAYTSKNVASASGAGQPSSAATPELLLEEAVLSYMDEFNGRLMTHFTDMFTNGREVKIMVKLFDGAGIDLTESYDYNGGSEELGMIIEDWIAANAVNKRYSLSDGTENFQKYEQVRIPMTYTRNGQERAMDTRLFVTDLKKLLSGAPYNLESKVYLRGLGEAWLIIGEK